MINERPIQNPDLQAALDEFKEVMQRYGLAGCCMLVAPEEAGFTYALHAPWSAIRPDGNSPLGFRIRAVSKEIGNAEAKKQLEGALHTICMISDFGEQTTAWMEDIKLMLRRAGVDFDHNPFGGEPLRRLAPLKQRGSGGS